MKNWYQITAKKHNTEISIYDEIGAWGISAKDFVNDLKKISGNIDLRVHSPGGSVIDGVAIYNAIKRHDGEVTAYIDGLAASMASFIIMAADKRIMANAGWIMIHNPWGLAVGDSDEMRKSADLMDKMKSTLLNGYTSVTGMSEDEVSVLMNDETWMDSEESLEYGFVDELEDQVEMAASFDLDKYKFQKAPGQLTAQAATKKEVNVMTDKVKAEAAAAELLKNTNDAVAQAKVAEGERKAKINLMFKGHEFQSQLLIECLSDSDITSEMAGQKLLAKLGEGQEPVNKLRIDVVVDAVDKFRGAASDALAFRAGIAKATESGNPFRAHTLLDMAKEVLNIHSVNTTGMDRMRIAGAAFTHSSGDFPSLLEDTLGKAMRAAYGNFPDTWQMWADRSSVPDFKVNSRIQLGSFNSLAEIKEGGEYTSGTFSDEKETIQAVTKGKMISFTRQAIINDDLAGFTRIAQLLGRAAARTINADVYGILTANAAMADGVALFHADHSNLNTSTALSLANIGVAKTAMRKQTDADGNDYLNIMPKYLVVPVALEDSAKTLIMAETDFSNSNSKKPNIHRNTLEVISDPVLDADSATTWYMMADAMEAPVVEVAFLDGNSDPYLESQEGFTVDGVQWKVRLDYGVGSIEDKGAQKNTA